MSMIATDTNDAWISEDVEKVSECKKSNDNRNTEYGSNKASSLLHMKLLKL
jgi:hypothetical protein